MPESKPIILNTPSARRARLWSVRLNRAVPWWILSLAVLAALVFQALSGGSPWLIAFALWAGWTVSTYAVQRLDGILQQMAESEGA